MSKTIYFLITVGKGRLHGSTCKGRGHSNFHKCSHMQRNWLKIWKTSLVIPIPKSGNSSDPGNYRPISLLPIVSKVLEVHVCYLLKDYVSISDEQWGFQQGKSTTNAILSATSTWFDYLESGFEVQAVFFDLQKAFDSVPHCLLIEKLHSIGIPTHLIRWISNYLLDRTQMVGVDGKHSPPSRVVSGVPQGSVLGPLLFILYIDGLTSLRLDGGSIVLFADDLLLYRVIRRNQDFELVQKDIDNLESWLTRYKLLLNPRKCKSLLISRKRVVSSRPCFRVGSCLLERVSSYKYLGGVISSDLSWSEHVSGVTKKARKQIGLLYRRFYKSTPTETLKTLYTSLICPHLEYAIPVWNPHLSKDIDSLESVQRFATKICTKSWSDTSYLDRLRNLRLDTLQKRRALINQCHLYKLVNGLCVFPNSPLTHSHNHGHATRSSSHSRSLTVPFAHSNSYYFSFFCDAPRTWNSLPSSVINSASLNIFKEGVANYL